MQRFETLVSSARSRTLSNTFPRILNSCLSRARRLLPQSCLLCGADESHGPYCEPCRTDLPWLARDRCRVCALPLASSAVCGSCLDRPPHFDGVEAAFSYSFPVNALIPALKYGGRLALAHGLGEQLASAITREVDVIVPMPLAPARLAERGFNQALEIARIVATLTGVPLLRDACRKVANTPPQASLPWGERAKNVRRAFVCEAEVAGARIAVVDDVLTTGATLNELARVLRRAGAVEVVGWVVARTLPA